MSLTQGSQTGVKPLVSGANPAGVESPARPRRRRASENALRRPNRRRRPPVRSPGSRASNGASVRSWGGASSPESSSWRRPEFGRGRFRCYGAREEELVVATGSWCCTEHGEALRCELARLWPRLRHGRRREALGRDGKWS